jgi:hypothetical protein
MKPMQLAHRLRDAVAALVCALLLGCVPASVEATTLYVDLNNPSPAPPYTNWLMAATNIQDAVGAAAAGDTVLVSNGVYQAGGVVLYGAVANRVAVTNAITLLSLNGPEATMILGGPAMRCAYLGSNAVLSGFTLTNGQTRMYQGDQTIEQSGGGVWAEVSAVVSNC